MDAQAEALQDVLECALDWRAAGRPVALATVLETWGSSPCPAGSQLVVDARGAFVGSVSGGCVEAAVVDAALGAMQSGGVRLLEFGVSDEAAWDAGLACGGRIRVCVARVDPDSPVLEQLVAERAARRAAVLVTRLDSGAQTLVRGGASAHADPALRPLLEEAFTAEVARVHPLAQGEVFVQSFHPALRMFIVGAVHVAQQLAPMALRAGYDVIVIDPRSAFATASRFPGIALSRLWPDSALAGRGLDRRCAVVTLSHDAKLDEPALVAALASDAVYVGALGSRRTHAARRARLRARGLDEDALDRIHAPVGLDIGARSPAEIAVSILAQVTQRLRRGAA
ncbi:MAG: XdhC family protein [Myxococcales bacterium]|nr:XdhC family protein [Myxococcales bacterium]